MNDRFKLRVWDKENKCMHYPSRYSNFNIVNGVIVKIDSYLTGNGVYRGKGIAYEFDDAILMQSTGNKDKNGKLIYEGDVVKTFIDRDIVIGVIAWCDKELRYYLNTTDYFGDKYVTDFDIYKSLSYEVIGNIYENKELLNENS